MRLIVNADDFGLCPGVNQGIIEAYRHGVVTSTTLMMNLVDETGRQLLAENPGLGVGVHLNATLGYPVLPPQEVPSLLTSEGKFLRPVDMLLAAARPEELDRELRAQVAKALAWGIKPTHLDSHHHLHQYLEVFPTVLNIARDYRIRGIRGYNPSEYRRQGLMTTDCLRTDFFDNNATTAKLQQIIGEFSRGSLEIMCHPGYCDESLQLLSSHTAKREEELRILCSREFFKLLLARRIKLIHFGQLN